MQRIGRYEIEAELGRGAMGVVFRARDPAIGRTVAIKTIRLSDLGGTQDRERLGNRLLHEARSAGVLSHPGIVTIYDVSEHDDVAYIAMEFVNGPTLEQVLASDEPPDPALLFRVLKSTAAALDYAHKKAIVHRDIKPANIMIHEDGAVKITDFGVAKIQAGQLATQTGTVVGTPCYMSPEQALGRAVDGRSDQFSLAVVAYEMLTGEKPFGSENVASVVYKIAHEEPPPTTALNHTLGRQVDVAIKRALEKVPAGRFPTCSEFVASLERACQAAPGWKPLPRGGSLTLPTLEVKAPAPPPQPLPAVSSPEPAQEVPEAGTGRKRRTAVVALIVAGVAVVIAGAAWLGQQFQTGTPPQPSAAQVAPVATDTRPSPAGPATPKVEPEVSGGLSAGTEEGGETKAEVPLTQPAKTSARTDTKLPAEVTALVRTTPPGANVLFDSRPELSCTSPCSIQLSAGRHTASATLDGYRTALRIFQLPDEGNVFLYLVRLTGQVQVQSEPSGASILVDGQRRAETTPATFELPAGKHTVAVVRQGYQQDEQEIELKDSAFMRLSFTLGK